MPREFKKNLSNCIVIIDCFEGFLERPSGLMAMAQTWSNYKHHNTVKFLIGISPQGSISFISKGWGDRVSDRYLIEHCGILDHLLPSDVISDRYLIEHCGILDHLLPSDVISDRYLIEHCGILDHLLPSDVILADRGFNVHEAARLYLSFHHSQRVKNK